MFLKNKRYYIIFICVWLSHAVSAIVPDDVKFVVEGITMDATDLKTLPYVNVINLRSKVGVTSNGNGGFSIDLLPGDTLEFSSVGFQSQKQQVLPDKDKEKKLLFIYLQPKRYDLNEVQIEGEQGIPKSMQSDVFNGDPNVGQAIVSPLSFMYYKFNKKEKRKRQLRDEVNREQNMAHVLSVYNKDLIAEFSGLQGEALEQCVIYCNTNIELSPRDGEQSIKLKLLDLLSEYFKTLNTTE